MLISPALIPRLYFHGVPPHIYLETVVIKDCGNVLHSEFICCITDEEVGFANTSISN